MDFSNKTYRDHLILRSPEKYGFYQKYIMVIIQPQIILLERGVWDPPPRKFLLELGQNPAILDNSGGYTSLVIATLRVETAHFETD